MSVPTVPTAQLRAAIEAADWAAASQLLDHHHQETTRALAARAQGTTDVAPAEWVELLVAQRAMLEEIRKARDAAERALSGLGQQHRGARAYLQQSAA